MKIKFVGETFGIPNACGLVNNKIYECIGIEFDLLRVIDESEEDYLYSSQNPRPLDNSSKGGKWEIIEDDEENTLYRVIYNKEIIQKGKTSDDIDF